MNTNLESGLATYLTARLAGLGQTLRVVPANTREEADPREPGVIVEIRSFQHQAGPATGTGGIYTAEISLSLQTPVLPSESNAAHAEAESLLMTLMTESVSTELEDALFAHQLVLCGKYFVGWEDNARPGAWGSAALWRLGLQFVALEDLETFVRSIPATRFVRVPA